MIKLIQTDVCKTVPQAMQRIFCSRGAFEILFAVWSIILGLLLIEAGDGAKWFGDLHCIGMFAKGSTQDFSHRLTMCGQGFGRQDLKEGPWHLCATSRQTSKRCSLPFNCHQGPVGGCERLLVLQFALKQVPSSNPHVMPSASGSLATVVHFVSDVLLPCRFHPPTQCDGRSHCVFFAASRGPILVRTQPPRGGGGGGSTDPNLLHGTMCFVGAKGA